MTVIRPNSISGVSSITTNGGDLSLFRSDGTTSDIIVNNVTSGIITATTFSGNVTGGTINAASATITGNLGVGGVLTYEDVTNIDSIGIVTARLGINLVGNDLNVGSNIKIGNASGIITATSFRGDASQMTGAGLGTDGSANTSGIITATAFVSDTALSHRNLIINGAMMVAQRGTSSSASSGGFTCDRFGVYPSGLDEAPTQQQISLDSSDTGPYETGFRNALKITNGNQTSGAGASDNLRILYKVEAQDLANSGWNYTSASSYITLSFWVKSSVAQNFYIQFRTKDGTEQNYTTETGSLTADTWTKVTKTIPGNSNLTFNNDNGVGTEINIWQFAGTDLTGSMTLNQWAAYSGSARMPDMTSTWYTTDNATFEITGVQLEVGPVATPFEHKNFREQLSDCQRYFFNIKGNNDAFMGIAAFANSSSVARFAIYFPVPMRTNPTYSGSGNLIFDSNNDSASFAASSCTIINGTSSYILSTGGVSSVCLQSPGTSGMSGNSGGGMIMRSNPTTLNFDAEL